MKKTNVIYPCGLKRDKTTNFSLFRFTFSFVRRKTIVNMYNAFVVRWYTAADCGSVRLLFCIFTLSVLHLRRFNGCVCAYTLKKTESNFVRFLRERRICVCVEACVCLFLLVSLFDIIVDFVFDLPTFLSLLLFLLPFGSFEKILFGWCLNRPAKSRLQPMNTNYEWLTKYSQPTHIERHASCSFLHLLYFSFLILFSVRR